MRSPVADLVLAGPGLEEEFLARAETHRIDGVDVSVIAVSDLMVLKVLAGRAKDLEDVAMLLQAQGSAVDRAHVRRVLGLLEEALGQSDLLATFEQIQSRIRF